MVLLGKYWRVSGIPPASRPILGSKCSSVTSFGQLLARNEMTSFDPLALLLPGKNRDMGHDISAPHWKDAAEFPAQCQNIYHATRSEAGKSVSSCHHDRIAAYTPIIRGYISLASHLKHYGALHFPAPISLTMRTRVQQSYYPLPTS